MKWLTGDERRMTEAVLGEQPHPYSVCATLQVTRMDLCVWTVYSSAVILMFVTVMMRAIDCWSGLQSVKPPTASGPDRAQTFVAASKRSNVLRFTGFIGRILQKWNHLKIIIDPSLVPPLFALSCNNS